MGAVGHPAPGGIALADLLPGILQHAPPEHRYAMQGRPGCARMEGWLLAAHFAMYGAVLVGALGVGGALAFALVHHFLTGLYMASIFAPNHKGMPLTNGGTRGFLREQVLTSRNIGGNWLIDLVYGGLNYQIEHHLFPTLPRNNLKRVAPIVRAYCDVHAITYSETSVFRSWQAILGHYNDVSRAVSALKLERVGVVGEQATAADA